MGGEEFAWILPEAQMEGAWAAVERARESISEVPYEGIGTLTISIGLSLRAEMRDAAEALHERRSVAL